MSNWPIPGADHESSKEELVKELAPDEPEDNGKEQFRDGHAKNVKVVVIKSDEKESHEG
jgi:hypothetical protein